MALDAIGFIIEEVLTAIFTGGAKTVAQALRLTLDSITSAVNTVRKVGKKVARKPIDFIHGISVLLKKLKHLNVKKMMDEFVEWIKNLVKTTKQLAQEAFDRFFPNTAQGMKDRRYLRKRGYQPTSFVDDVLTICPIGR